MSNQRIKKIKEMLGEGFSFDDEQGLGKARVYHHKKLVGLINLQGPTSKIKVVNKKSYEPRVTYCKESGRLSEYQKAVRMLKK